jgi:calcineurin-like phosphoesterase family protein
VTSQRLSVIDKDEEGETNVRRRTHLIALVAAAVVVATASPAAADDALKVVAAGDICGLHCDRTANMIFRSTTMARVPPSLVLMLGDGAYPDGTLGDYQTAYDPFWGRFKAITQAAPGNHDYATDNAAGYRDYFGLTATEPIYRSFDEGGWHFVQYDTENVTIEEVDWIRQDLATAAGTCDIAFGHRPRWSSGANGSDDQLAGLWDEFAAANVDVVLNGHDHDYERIFRDGIREFVVGTGGRSLTAFNTPIPESEFRYNATYGVLILSLAASGYRWWFKALGGTVIDSGTGVCR